MNCVLVGEAAEPGDPAAIRQYSEHARDYLDLGLEHMTSGDAEQASDVVRDITLREIFQVGHSLTLRVKRAAEKMLAEPGTKFGETVLCLDEEAAAVAALTRRRPLKALKVAGAEPVPFRSKKELAEAVALLERVRQQRGVISALLGTSPADTVARFGVTLAHLTPQRLFAAVVARAEIDGVIEAAPFPAERLQELAARIFELDGLPRLRSSAGKKALEVLQSRLSVPAHELELMIARVMQTFVIDFGQAWTRDSRVDSKKLLVLPVSGEIPL